MILQTVENIDHRGGGNMLKETIPRSESLYIRHGDTSGNALVEAIKARPIAEVAEYAAHSMCNTLQ